MKFSDITKWIDLLAAPVLTVLVGLILLFDPDLVFRLAGGLIAWVLVIAGVGFGIAVFFGDPNRRHSRILWAAICLCGGIWLLMNPLALTKAVCRVLGLALLLQTARNLNWQLKYHNGKLVPSAGLLLCGATGVIGLVLLVLPLSTSRLVFSVVGVVLVAIGAGMFLDQFRHRNYLEAGNPDIIDGEKL